MKDLILRTRLEALKQNLRQVEQVVDSIQERRRELLQLADILSGSGQSIQLTYEAIEAIQSSRTSAKRLEQGEESRKILNKLQEAEDALTSVVDKLGKAEKIITAMHARSVQIKEEELGSTLKLALGKKATTWIRDLEEICQKRERAEQEEYNGQTSTAEQLLQEAWTEYLSDIYKNSQRIFEEYIDFLGGLALRDTNVDLGICQIADELIRKWVMITDAKWKSLTIPARHETVEMSLARIIRLGFPEWTIWALPLTAQGFGHIILHQDVYWERYIMDQHVDELGKLHLYNYLADAFATYAMGPAYVFAALLLRFDPLLAYQEEDGQPPSAKRAHVVFAMLKQMDRKSRATVYKSIITRLEEEWRAVLRQVGPSGSPLTSDDEKNLEQWVNDLWEYLDSNTYVLYPHKSWQDIQDWPEKLLQGDVESISLFPLADLRDVLNAAWLARISQPDKTEIIADAARTLWQRIDERDRKSKQLSESSMIGTRSSMRLRG